LEKSESDKYSKDKAKVNYFFIDC